MITVNTPCPWGKRIKQLDAKTVTKSEKTWAALQISSGKKTAKYFSTSYGLGKSALSKWVRDSQEPGGIHGVVDRPTYFTPEVKETITRTMQNLSYDIRNEDFTKMVSDAVEEDLTNNGLATAIKKQFK